MGLGPRGLSSSAVPVGALGRECDQKVFVPGIVGNGSPCVLPGVSCESVLRMIWSVRRHCDCCILAVALGHLIQIHLLLLEFLEQVRTKRGFLDGTCEIDGHIPATRL